MPERWAVPLEGDDLDLKDAKRLFSEGSVRVREVGIAHDQRAITLQADEFERNDSGLEILALAERFLDYLNGALFLAYPTRRPVRIKGGGTVRERGETGIYDRQHAFVRLSAGVRARASVSAVLTTSDGQIRPKL